jgi:hypothetical protein
MIRCLEAAKGRKPLPPQGHWEPAEATVQSRSVYRSPATCPDAGPRRLAYPPARAYLLPVRTHASTDGPHGRRPGAARLRGRAGDLLGRRLSWVCRVFVLRSAARCAFLEGRDTFGRYGGLCARASSMSFTYNRTDKSPWNATLRGECMRARPSGRNGASVRDCMCRCAECKCGATSMMAPLGVQSK